jgi:DNA-binding beta-propeller fold protein YncE
MRAGRWFLLVLGGAAAACAPTLGPATPPVEVLVVLDSLDDSLRIIPVDSPSVVHHILINTGSSVAAAFALHGRIAAIGFGDAVTMLDLGLRQVICTQQLNGKGPVGSLTFTDGGQAYAATPTTDSVALIDAPNGCGVAQGSARGRPRGFGVARGIVFVLVSTKNPCAPPAPDCKVQSWLSTEAAHLRDSFPLGPGLARGAVSASDGFLYVINTGDNTSNGLLLQVDPRQPESVNTYTGFGHLPQSIATDGGDHVFVASPTDGLMVFNVRSHQVEKGAGPLAVALPGPARALATDDFGRIYALIPGTCAAGAHGIVQPLDSTLVAQHPITVGRCPIAIGVTEIPAALYRFDN